MSRIIFFAYFWSRRIFFRRPFRPDYFFLNHPKLLLLNRGGGGGVDLHVPTIQGTCFLSMMRKVISIVCNAVLGVGKSVYGVR